MCEPSVGVVEGAVARCKSLCGRGVEVPRDLFRRSHPRGLHGSWRARIPAMVTSRRHPLLAATTARGSAGCRACRRQTAARRKKGYESSDEEKRRNLQRGYDWCLQLRKGAQAAMEHLPMMTLLSNLRCLQMYLKEEERPVAAQPDPHRCGRGRASVVPGRPQPCRRARGRERHRDARP